MSTFLTPQEEKVMLKIWQLGEGSVKEVLELYKPPKPAYNTVSTFVRILERKKYLKHKKNGRGFIYSPRVSREEYRGLLVEHLLANYYDSDVQLLSSDAQKHNNPSKL